jgi:hypothetical protein
MSTKHPSSAPPPQPTPPSKARNRIDGDLKPAANTNTTILNASTIAQLANIALLNKSVNTFSITKNLLETFNKESEKEAANISWTNNQQSKILRPTTNEERNKPPDEISTSLIPIDEDPSKYPLTSLSPKSSSTLTPSRPISPDEILLSSSKIIDNVNNDPDYTFKPPTMSLKATDHVSEEHIRLLFPDATLNF